MQQLVHAVAATSFHALFDRQHGDLLPVAVLQPQQLGHRVVGRGFGGYLVIHAGALGTYETYQNYSRYRERARWCSCSVKARRLAAAAVIQMPALYIYAWYLRSEEHTSELQSLMRISYAVFC